MADLTPIFQAAGAQYNVDPNILRAIAQQESSMRPDAVNPASGAAGLMGFTPATAKAYGINPLDPAQAIPAAARMFSENLQRFNGNVEDAVAAHFAGPNQKLWGAQTAQYVDNVSNKFQQLRQGQPEPAVASPQSADPILSMAQSMQANTGALAQTASAPPTNDPVLAMAQGIASTKSANTPQANVIAPAPGSPQGQWQAPGGFVMGLGDVVRGGAQDIVNGLAWAANKIAPNSQFAKDANAALPQMRQTVTQQNQAYDAARTAAGNTGTDWSRVAGQAVGAAPLAAALPTGSGVLGTIGAGALSGAANGALQPVGASDQSFGAEKFGQILPGAAIGAIAGPLVAGAGNLIRGATGAAQQRLAQAGVNMTPGQILGGAWQRTEDKLTSVPVLGDLIKNAQQRSVQSFNRATYNQVLQPLGQTYNGPVGNEGVQAVQNTISNAYDSALSRMTFRATDPQFQTEVQNLAGMAQNLPPAQQQTFANVLQTQIFGKLGPQGQMDGPTLKGVQSELSRIARGYSGDASFDNRQLGAAIGEIRNAVDNSLPRYNAPDAVQDLANANAAYANFVRLRGAAASQGAMNNGGVFTGAQLNSAVRGADKSVGKGASATGNALMQDFSGAGQQVLGSKYPDSGTAGRSMLGLMAAALAGHAFLPPEAAVPAAIGVGAASLPYMPYGQRLAQALLLSRPTGAVPVGNALLRYGVPLAPTLGVPLVQGVAHAQ